ncbi:MAG: cytochrome P450 [Proteobacteria bacterium]|nr:cytochrome P450 [Pseudomonadota bacterium]
MDQRTSSPGQQAARFELRSGEGWRNPFPMYRALRDHDPVHLVEEGDYWVLSRFAEVFAAVTDATTFSSASGLTVDYSEMEELGLEAPIVMMDPPAHNVVRKLGVKQFTPARVRAIEELVRDLAVERIEKLREMGSGDIVAELFKPIPSRVVGHFLGVPESVRERFDDWSEAIVAANAEGEIDRARDAVGEMFQLFSELIERRRADPGDDLFSALVTAEVNGEPLSMAVVLGFGFTMVAGGNDTSTGLMAGAAELLTASPEQRRTLAADPSGLPAAVEEFLRLTSPVQGLARTTTRDVQLCGRTIPEGRKVMLLYASANRDEREFGDDADHCDPCRSVARHLALGYGQHHCIGAAAARLMGRVALGELLARCPDFSVDADAGRYAEGNYVRRFKTLPFEARGQV